MAETQDNYEVETEPDTEVEVISVEETDKDSSLQADNEDSEEDQFKKAESSTQKRIDRLGNGQTKKRANVFL